MKLSHCCYLMQLPKCIYHYEIRCVHHLYQIVPNYSLFDYKKEKDLFRYNSHYRRQFKNIMYQSEYVDNHHIIPKQFQNHKLIQELNVDVACSKNILFMRNRYAKKMLYDESLIYHDSHAKYNQFVNRELQIIASSDDDDTKKYQFWMFFMYLWEGISENDTYIKSLFS